MTSKLVVNTIEADTGISSVSFASSISMNSTAKFHFSAAGIDIGADTNINRPAAGVLGFNVNGAEKVRIDSSGHMHGVGVVTATHFYGDGSNLTGLTVPGGATNLDLLDSSGTGNGRIRLGASQDLQIYHDGSHSWMANDTGRLIFQTDGDQIQLRGNTIVAFNGAASTEYLRITSTGLGIGGVTPTRELTLYSPDSGSTYINLTNSTTGTTTGDGFGIGLGGDEVARLWNYENTSMEFATNSIERLRITSAGTVNIGGSTQTTHLLYLQSTGDASIHLAADTDNVTEDHNPSISMSQDGGGSAQMFKIGMEAGNGAEFSQSIGNGCYIHANNSSSQPLQLAHMDNLAVTISSVHGSHFHTYSGNTVAGVKIANRGNDTAAALLLQGHNNTGTPGQATNTQLTHLGGNLEFEINHNGGRAIHVGSSRRIRLPGIVGVAGSGLQTVYVESDGNLCTTSSLRQYKTNITAISDTSWLYDLNPVTFNWKKKTEVDGENVWEDTADDNGTQYGLIAEEVEAVKKDFCSYDNNNKLTGVHYDRIIAPLIKAVQEQKKEIDSLKAEVAALKGS